MGREGNARLGALDYGYATVSGSIDDATELRDQLARTLSEDERRIAEIKPGRP